MKRSDSIYPHRLNTYSVLVSATSFEPGISKAPTMTWPYSQSHGFQKLYGRVAVSIQVLNPTC